MAELQGGELLETVDGELDGEVEDFDVNGEREVRCIVLREQEVSIAVSGREFAD